MEKRALPYIQGELLRLHSNNAQMLIDESELEFLKVASVEANGVLRALTWNPPCAINIVSY